MTSGSRPKLLQLESRLGSVCCTYPNGRVWVLSNRLMRALIYSLRQEHGDCMESVIVNGRWGQPTEQSELVRSTQR